MQNQPEHALNQDLVIDGQRLNGGAPFAVYESFPRNESIKSNLSTVMCEKTQNRIFEQIQQEVAKEYPNFQFLYQAMLRMRAQEQTAQKQGKVVKNKESSLRLGLNCSNKKCLQIGKSIYRNEFERFQFPTF